MTAAPEIPFRETPPAAASAGEALAAAKGMPGAASGAFPGAGPGGLLGLLQLADSCFPAGSFAFSNGLEALAKGGWLRGLEDYRQYLESYLAQVASAELPFLNSAFALAPAPRGSAATPFPADGPPASAPESRSAALPSREFALVAWEWDAFLVLPAPRRASLSLGRAWLRAMEGATGDPAVAALATWFRAEDVPPHFLMAFAASLRAVGHSLEEAQGLLMHMALRDQLGAAVRLGLVGSLQAQGLHRGFLPAAESLRAMAAGLGHERSLKTAPMIEMGQAAHPYLYSRLFQS
jgi:urease accessory protein